MWLHGLAEWPRLKSTCFASAFGRSKNSFPCFPFSMF